MQIELSAENIGFIQKWLDQVSIKATAPDAVESAQQISEILKTLNAAQPAARITE